MVLAESTVRFGLLITAVGESSPAESGGMHPRDIVLEYDGKPIQDITSYVAAAEEANQETVPLKVWRDAKEVILTVPTGYLGFQYEDWNPARKRIYESIGRGDLEGARHVAASAEKEGSLTPVQTLIVKLLLIPDRSRAERENERSELLTQLLTVYPTFHLNKLAGSEFAALHGRKAAAKCYEEYLRVCNPEDVDVRLNLANCYVLLFDFERAERQVHYIVDRPDPQLSPYGLFVAREISGGIALGRANYGKALDLFSQAFEQRTDDYVFMMALYSAARLGDLRAFEEIRDRGARRAPDNVKKMQFYVDTLKTYLLAAKGRNGEAAALIRKWGTPKCIVETADSYWSTIPGGSDITAQLQSLLKNV
jgi:tetratricopeptide (TPR) repeat protein